MRQVALHLTFDARAERGKVVAAKQLEKLLIELSSSRGTLEHLNHLHPGGGKPWHMCYAVPLTQHSLSLRDFLSLTAVRLA